MSSITGFGPGSDDIGREASPTSWGSAILRTLVVLGVIVILIGLLLPAMQPPRWHSRQGACLNNLKQVALGLQAYQGRYGTLPPAYTTDTDGKPLHSWRTLILPFLEEEELYKTIDLTKPWNDPVNAEAFKSRMPIYSCPSAPISDLQNYTTYLAVVTPTSCLRGGEPRKLSQITDSKADSLLVIEVDSEHAVPWMSPVDADEQLAMEVGSKSKPPHPEGFNAAFVDGSVRLLKADMPAAQRRALISIAGNDKAAARGER